MGDGIEAFRRAEDGELTLQVLDVGEFVIREPATGHRRLAFQETFGSFRDVAPRVAAAAGLANRGAISRALGDLDSATRDLEMALTEFRALGDERAEAQTLGRL